MNTYLNEISLDIWMQWIQDAIEKLRASKEIPSAINICRVISKDHNFNIEAITEKIDRVYAAGAITNVKSLGVDSYQLPLVKPKLKVQHNVQVYEEVKKAIYDLDQCEGSRIETIRNYLRIFYDIENDAAVDLKTVIRNSINAFIDEGLIKQDGDYYKRNKILTKTPQQEEQESESSSSSSSKATDDLHCVACYGNSKRNWDGKPEPLTSCSKCKVSLHTTCANYEVKSDPKPNVLLYVLVTKGNQWFCQKCATCSVCDTSCKAKGLCLLQCVICKKTFHFTCLDSEPEKTPRYAYRCDTCRDKKVSSSAATNPDDIPTTSKHSEQKLSEKEQKRLARLSRLSRLDMFLNPLGHQGSEGGRSRDKQSDIPPSDKNSPDKQPPDKEKPLENVQR